MNLQNAKVLIAREGLILFIFLASFIIGLFTNNNFFIVLPFWGYPLYLVIRFIHWALRTLFPQYFLPWGKIESFTKTHNYREALEFIEDYEKRHPDIKERFKDDKGWNLLKKTCFEGIFMSDYYVKSHQLMEAKKYEEAKKIATEGYKLMIAFGDSLGITKEVISKLNNELKERFNDLKNIKISDIGTFRKEHIGKITASDPESNIPTFFDLLLTPVLCDALAQGDSARGV